jgi:hypothetical protein
MRGRPANPTEWDIREAARLRIQWRLQDEAEIEEQREMDSWVMLEPCRIPTPLSVPATPGNATAARREGCEDEFENALMARYGEDF